MGVASSGRGCPTAATARCDARFRLAPPSPRLRTTAVARDWSEARASDGDRSGRWDVSPAVSPARAARSRSAVPAGAWRGDQLPGGLANSTGGSPWLPASSRAAGCAPCYERASTIDVMTIGFGVFRAGTKVLQTNARAIARGAVFTTPQLRAGDLRALRRVSR